MRKAFALLVALAFLSAPCPAQEVEGETRVPFGSHGILRLSGVPEGESAASWSAVDPGVKVSSVEGGMAAAWSSRSPGKFTIKLIYINWDDRILVERFVSVESEGASPVPVPPPVPTPGPTPTPTPDPVPTPAVAELDVILLYDAFDTAADRRAVESIPTDPSIARLHRINVDFRFVDIRSEAAASAGMTREWLIGLPGSPRPPAVVYLDASRSPARVLRVERPTSAAAIFEAARQLKGVSE